MGLILSLGAGEARRPELRILGCPAGVTVVMRSMTLPKRQNGSYVSFKGAAWAQLCILNISNMSHQAPVTIFKTTSPSPQKEKQTENRCEKHKAADGTALSNVSNTLEKHN